MLCLALPARRKVWKLDFQSEFSTSKIISISLNFFHADKNGLGEYLIMNSRPFLLRYTSFWWSSDFLTLWHHSALYSVNSTAKIWDPHTPRFRHLCPYNWGDIQWKGRFVDKETWVDCQLKGGHYCNWGNLVRVLSCWMPSRVYNIKHPA